MGVHPRSCVTGTQALLQQAGTPLTDTDCASMEKHHRTAYVRFCLKVPPLLLRVYLARAAARAGVMHALSQISHRSLKSLQRDCTLLTAERFATPVGEVGRHLWRL